MTTDRELLEMAAKAAGIYVPKLVKGVKYPRHYLDETGIHEDMSGGGDGTRWRSWSPLHNDGDALRLAVKLNLWEAVRDGHQHLDSDGDHYAATRRAIVRAAAEIGKAMP
jgi:hypothetical protein